MEQREYVIKYRAADSPKCGAKIKKRKKLEFMQKIVLVALALPYVWVTCSYVFAWFEVSNPLESLSGYVVTVPIAAIVGYITQNCVRSATLNMMTAKINSPDIPLSDHIITEQSRLDSNIKEMRDKRGT